MCFSTLINSAEQYGCIVFDCLCILHIYNISRPGMYSCFHLSWLGLTSQAEIMDYQIGPSNAVERVYKIPKPKVTTLCRMMLPFDVHVANRAELNSSSPFFLFSFFFPAIRNLMEQLQCLPRHHAQMHHYLWQVLLLKQPWFWQQRARSHTQVKFHLPPTASHWQEYNQLKWWSVAREIKHWRVFIHAIKQ